MTRDEARAKCIEVMGDASYERTGARMPYGLLAYLFDSLHGIAAVCPILSGDRDHLVLGGDLTNTPEKADEHKK